MERNKKIKKPTAEAFYLTGDIEKYGSGFVRIRKEMIPYPSMRFAIEAAPNGILTTLSYIQQKITDIEKVVEKVVEKKLKIS